MDNKFHLFSVVESWHDSAFSPSVVAATPTTHQVIERARPRDDDNKPSLGTNHGGICVFAQNAGIRINIIDFPTYTTFEILPLCVRHGARKTAYITIYQPKPLSLITDAFFDEISDVFERCASYSDCIIVGDINLHLDDIASLHTSRFLLLLEDFGLVECVGHSSLNNQLQRVAQPTHIRQHQLDVFITRSDHQPSMIRVDPPVISDHSLISASFVDVSEHPTSVTQQRTPVKRRCWKKLCLESFVDDLQQSNLLLDPSTDVDSLFSCYDVSLRSLLDKHAPTVNVVNYARPSAPWFDSECHQCKVTTRKLERRYRSCPSSDCLMEWRYQFQRQRDLFQSKSVNYWSNAINTCPNVKSLWSKVRCILQPQENTIFQHSADDFAQHFKNKVNAIRSSTSTAPKPVLRERDIDERLSTFDRVTDQEVMQILKKSPAKHCSLDPIPTWLLKNIVDVITPTITRLCNASIDQCSLPSGQKCALTHPLLKKVNARSSGFELLSTNIKSQLHLEDSRADYRRQADSACSKELVIPCSSVRLPVISFNGNRFNLHPQRFDSCDGYWTYWSFGAARLISSFRHCRPYDHDGGFGETIWTGGDGIRLVQLVFQRKETGGVRRNG